MKLLVIGAGMMGSAAAYDMARAESVDSVTLADTDRKRARDAASRINKLARTDKVRAVEVDASSEKASAKLMRGHDAALSAVPYFYNLGLARAAVEARCTLPISAATTPLSARNWRGFSSNPERYRWSSA